MVNLSKEVYCRFYEKKNKLTSMNFTFLGLSEHHWLLSNEGDRPKERKRNR